MQRCNKSVFIIAWGEGFMYISVYGRMVLCQWNCVGYISVTFHYVQNLYIYAYISVCKWWMYICILECTYECWHLWVAVVVLVHLWKKRSYHHTAWWVARRGEAGSCVLQCRFKARGLVVRPTDVRICFCKFNEQHPSWRWRVLVWFTDC